MGMASIAQLKQMNGYSVSLKNVLLIWLVSLWIMIYHNDVHILLMKHQGIRKSELVVWKHYCGAPGDKWLVLDHYKIIKIISDKTQSLSKATILNCDNTKFCDTVAYVGGPSCQRRLWPFGECRLRVCQLHPPCIFIWPRVVSHPLEIICL